MAGLNGEFAVSRHRIRQNSHATYSHLLVSIQLCHLWLPVKKWQVMLSEPSVSIQPNAGLHMQQVSVIPKM